jgi:hypothetical protein
VPPLQALAALHGFWFMLAGAATVLAVQRLSPHTLSLGGKAAVAVGLVGLFVFVALDLLTWLRHSPAEFRPYAFQRVVFCLGANMAVPLLPLAMAGAVCWLIGKNQSRRKTIEVSTPGQEGLIPEEEP